MTLSMSQTQSDADPSEFGVANNTAPAQNRWQDMANAAILVLGSPRSGTTWLAKIFDSHPSTLYRHEPDELIPPTYGLDPSEQIRAWLQQRGLRAAAKRPYFRKTWRPLPLENARRGFVVALAVTQRMPALARFARLIGVPDLVAPTRRNAVRGLLKLVNWDAHLAARTMPNIRCVFILRHPCGQIASVMNGLATQQEPGRVINPADGSFNRFEALEAVAAAEAAAARQGVDAASFAALPDVAKYAWSWRAFNEPAVAALSDMTNAYIVVYEDLCRQPEAEAQRLFAFAGLDWHAQTSAFLGTSTQHEGSSGYFDVFRATEQVADRWRQTMKPEQQAAVRDVVAASALARYWPDLASGRK